jgi:hypothetical protein
MRNDLDNDLDAEPGPLPREWLPEPSPREGDASWEPRVARILAATDWHPRSTEAALWGDLARWWRPSAALAAAAAAALVFVVADVPRPEPTSAPSGGLALTMIASDGNPVALWAALGIAADPLLALLVLEDPSATAAPADPTPSQEGPR